METRSRRSSALGGLLRACAILAAFAPALSGAEEARPEPARIAPAATEFTLENGMQVVVVPDHRAPIVTQMVWYKVGAADDPPGKSGIAHFLEHLMFKGTKKHPGKEYSERVSEGGGQENAFTTNDATAYYQTIGKERLAELMAFEADRMEGLVLTDAVVLPERDVILEERRMRVENSPGAQLGEAMNAAMFQNHHYGIPVIGWAHEMATLTRDDAFAQYDRYYTPNNAVLVVTGDITEDEVRKLAEETFGKVKVRAEPGPRVRPMEPPPPGARTVVLHDARVAQPQWSRDYLAPSYPSAKPGEAEALEVLADILGRGPTSRLYRSLVVEQGIASSAGAYFVGDGLDYGRFGIFVVPREGVSLDRVETAIDQAIAEMREHGVTEEELTRAKQRTRASAVYAQDSQATLARIIGTAVTAGQSLADVQSWPSRIDKVSAADVAAVANTYLDPRRSVTGSLLPAPADGRS